MLRRNNRVLRHRIKGGDLFWIEWSERAKCRGDIFFQYLPIYLAASGLGYVTWNPSLRRVDSLLWRRISRSMPQLLWHISLVAPGRVRPYSSTRGQTRVPCIAEVLVTQSYPTLCNPMDCSPSGSSVYGILQARILEWVAIPFSRESPQPRDRTWVSSIAGRFLITGPPGKSPGVTFKV